MWHRPEIVFRAKADLSPGLEGGVEGNHIMTPLYIYSIVLHLGDIGCYVSNHTSHLILVHTDLAQALSKRGAWALVLTCGVWLCSKSLSYSTFFL